MENFNLYSSICYKMLCDNENSLVYVVSILDNTDPAFPGMVYKQWMTEDENVAKNLLIKIENGEIPDLNIRHKEIQKIIEKNKNFLTDLENPIR